MKLLIGVCLTAAMLFGADAPPAKKADAPPKPPAVKVPGVPAGSVETEPGVYRFTDRDGKNWIYRNSPFGVMRFEDKPASPEKDDKSLQDIKATEVGDSIRFERPTPFGPFHWQKKKTELNETEKAVWERQQQNQAKRAQE
jgi:hypothetical protein